MSHQPEDAPPRSPAVEPVTDPRSLRDREGVQFHEDTDVVDRETFETVRELDDLAIVGVTNADGAVLLRRLTEDCKLKPPSIAVEPGEEFTATAHRAVEANTGLALAFEALEGAWRYEARLEDDEERAATRHFVVYSASPDGEAADGDPPAIPEDREAAEVAWYEEFPEAAAEPPGTELFFG